MKISARNVLSGKIQSVTQGVVNTEVLLALPGGPSIVSVITNASAEALGLDAGVAAVAIVKASDVMIGKDLAGAQLSARNLLAGTVINVQEGAVNSEVTVRLDAGAEVIAMITKASARALGLKSGDAVCAIVKASNVMIGV